VGVQLDTGGGKKSLRPVINVTPLVDVVLVLLIIFMVVIPNMQEHKLIELFPTTHAKEDTDEEKQAIVVTLAEDGTFHLAKEQVSRERILAELRRVKAEEPDRKILVRADVRLPYRQVRSFFYDVKEIGHGNIKLAVGAVRESDLGMGAFTGQGASP
jgi:biopolymer transport protein ExbD